MHRSLHAAILFPLDEMTVRHIREALAMFGGKINRPGGAAQLLGLHPNTLRTKMNKLGIPYGRRSWQHLGNQSGRTPRR